MIKTFAIQAALLAVLGGVWQAQATQVGLADWCVNLNGDTSTACNGAGSGSAAISLTNFNTTLEPGSNSSVSSITVTLGAGMHQFVGFYADYDVDYATWGSFDDSAKTSGSLSSGASYELDDPNSSNIFSDFAANSLKNTNTVATPTGPPSNCCDVSLAFSISNIDVATGGSAFLTFAVTNTAPTTGFYIQQTNQDTGNSLYFQELLTSMAPPPPPPPPIAPEPSSFALGLGLISAVIAWQRRRAL